MCNVKKYNKEVFKVGDTVNVICPMCNGNGGFNVIRAIDQFRDAADYEICPMCHGEGNLESKLSRCSHCKELVSEGDLTWVYDRNGTPYKQVCWGCYEEVDREVNHHEYDYLDDGEYIDEVF